MSTVLAACTQHCLATGTYLNISNTALCLQEEKALKALKEKAKGGSIGGAGLKKSGGKK